MKIGILGAGQVGGTLGELLAARGHAVRLSTRGTVAETAASGEVVILATPWAATEQVLRAAGDFAGRILLDATNPIGPGLTLAVGHGTSGGEQVAAWARGARVVKCFNTLGADSFGRPGTGAAQASMFFCGDDAAAKAVAAELVGALGFDPVDCGPLAQARYLEPLAMLWITLALKHGYGRDIAFRLLRR